MDSLLLNYDEGKGNFWKLYPVFKAAKIYKDFVAKDKSKNKIESSTIMWAMVFMFDKTEHNMWRLLDNEERLDLINEDILNNKDFDWKSHEDIWKYTENIFFTEDQRQYYTQLGKMEERRKLMEETSYTKDSAAFLDTLIKNTGGLRKEVDELKRVVDRKEADGKTKGNIIESASERNLI